MEKILFIHGLASSGRYRMADALRKLYPEAVVLSPDVPIDPDKAYEMLQQLCMAEHPDLIVGLSLGGFWAQKLRGYRKVLVNPGFHASELMRTMIGKVRYLCPRENGDTEFELTEEICDRYRELEASQFEGLNEFDKANTLGLFANRDEMVRCGDEFRSHYPGAGIDYDGVHLPDYNTVKNIIVPEIGRKFVSL